MGVVTSGEDRKPEALWIYYTNDEGKGRWKCSKCGKVCKRNPHDKIFCSRCGKRIVLEA